MKDLYKAFLTQAPILHAALCHQVTNPRDFNQHIRTNYIIQNHTILYYTILYYTILYYTILYYTILYYTILYYTILYYTILYYTILYYTILYYTNYTRGPIPKPRERGHSHLEGSSILSRDGAERIQVAVEAVGAFSVARGPWTWDLGMAPRVFVIPLLGLGI